MEAVLDLQEYKTVLKENTARFEEKKSIFISSVCPVSTENEALEYIKKIRGQYKDATHNTYAYYVVDGQEYGRYSDDGEPSGTAGMPMMESIMKQEVRNVVVVVTRYFGGIQLGAGGLIRAYSKATTMGIAAAIPVYKKLFTNIEVYINYNLLGKVQYLIENENYIALDTIYDDKVKMKVAVLKNDIETFKDKIKDCTNGQVDIEILDDIYLSVDGDNKIKE